MATHQAEIAIRRRISAFSDAYYHDSKKLGEIAWQAFQGNSNSQLRGLENIANSTIRSSDILDYIKIQTGRSRPTTKWRHKAFGETLIEKMENQLPSDAQVVLDFVKGEVKDHQLVEDDLRRIHIILCRELIKHTIANYLYSIGITPTSELTAVD